VPEHKKEAKEKYFTELTKDVLHFIKFAAQGLQFTPMRRHVGI
jgi:hypothetical protein